MKNIKKLVAIALTVAMLCAFSTVAFADALADANKANYDFFVKPATITQGTTEFTVEIGAYDTTGKTIDMPMASNSKASLYASLDSAAQSAGIKSTAIATEVDATTTYSSVHDTTTAYLSQFCLDLTFDKAAVSLGQDAPMAKVTFSIPADVAPGTYYLTFDSAKYDDLLLSDGTIGQAVSFPNVVGEKYALVTVTAAQTETTVTATNAGAAYETVFGEENSYWGVWVGSYKVTPGTKTMKKVSVAFTNSGHDAFEQDGLSITGSGEVTFKVAIVGVPETYKDASVATVTLQ